MKKCPYCAEDIREEAIKCKYCDSAIGIKKEGKNKRRFSPVIITILVILGIVVFWLVLDQKSVTDDNNKIIEAVGKLIALPNNETPELATITDKNVLKDQPFFAKAENGDTILIYRIANVGILYRRSTNEIIENMPVTFTDSPTKSSATPLSNNQVKADEWYIGGTLHKAKISEWKIATDRNKLATCSDFIAKVTGELSITKATNLKNCIDTATNGIDTVDNEEVATIASTCMVLERY